MNIFLILFVILIIIIIAIFYIQRPQQELKRGGNEVSETGEYCSKFKYLINADQSITIRHNKFNKIDMTNNKKIFLQLFEPNGVYEHFQNKLGGIETIQYIQKIAESEDSIYNSRDYSFDVEKLSDEKIPVTFTSQHCKNISTGVSYNPTYACSRNLEYSHMCTIFNALYRLPNDAASNGGKNQKYTCLIIQGGYAPYLTFISELYKNVKFILYNKTVSNNYENRGYDFKLEYFTNQTAELFTDKVDVFIIDPQDYITTDNNTPTYLNSIQNVEYAMELVHIIKPKYAALVKTNGPRPKNINIESLKTGNLDDCCMYRGKVLFTPFRPASMYSLYILMSPDDYTRGAVKMDYYKYIDRVYENSLDRIWKTYRPCIFKAFDSEGAPSGEYSDAPDFINISGFDRCYECTSCINLYARHLYKFDNANYNIKKIIELNNFATKYMIDLNFMINTTLKFKIETDSNKYETPHGIYNNLSRFEFHAEWIKLYKNIIYEKYIKLPNKDPPRIKSGQIIQFNQSNAKHRLCSRLSEFNKKIISSWRGSVEIGTKFEKLSVDENIKILNELFSSDGVYNQYRTRTRGTGCYEFIKSLAERSERPISRDDMIYDERTQGTVKRSPQEVYYVYSEKSQSRYLDINDNQTETSRRINQFASLMHSGKIKLFIADLQALLYLLPKNSTYPPKGDYLYTVLTIGSAPGNQTSILVDIFKNVKFIMYDCAEFNSNLLKYNNVVIKNELFLDSHVKEYAGKIDIFISDIRLKLHGIFIQDELQIHNDMMLQQSWVRGTMPRLGSMLKFRPPYMYYKIDPKENDAIPPPDKYTYLGGTVYWQVFPHKQSTEGRLLSTAKDIEIGPVPFNYEKYESASLEHNMRRVWCTYKAGIPTFKDNHFKELPELINVPGFDRCLDCAYLLYVCAEFVHKYQNYSPANVIGFMDFIIRNTKPLVCTCESNPHLLPLLNMHGLYQEMTRFQKQKKSIEMWDDYFYHLH